MSVFCLLFVAVTDSETQNSFFYPLFLSVLLMKSFLDKTRKVYKFFTVRKRCNKLRQRQKVVYCNLFFAALQ